MALIKGKQLEAATIKADRELDVAVPGAEINAGDAAAEGSAATGVRSDHQHSVATGAPGAIEPDDAAAEGVSSDLARADHTHSIVGAAPGQGIGGSNAEGVATSFARSDHDHTIRTTTGPTDLTVGAIADGDFVQRSGASLIGTASTGDTENVESLTTENITGTDTAMTDLLDATPLDVTKVRAYLNGIQQIYGAGNDFTIAGTTLTWLASSGTAVDMATTDSLRLVYLS